MGVGKIQEFDVKTGNWTAYCERLDMYFIANNIEDKVKLPTLIAVMGEDAYLLLSTLSSPKQPSALTYGEAVTLIKNHLQPKPSILAERYKFRQRRQVDGENVADYVAELKKLAKTCDFGSSLEENLRDQLVCGITSESTRQRLFAEDSITYNKAVKLAMTLEAAEKNACAVERDSSVGGATASVNKVHNFKCMACGDSGHKTEHCRYKNFECSSCRSIGHLRRMCPEKGAKPEFNVFNKQSRGERVTFSGPRGQRAGRGARGRGRWYSGRGRRRRWGPKFERGKLLDAGK